MYLRTNFDGAVFCYDLEPTLINVSNGLVYPDATKSPPAM